MVYWFKVRRCVNSLYLELSLPYQKRIIGCYSSVKEIEEKTRKVFRKELKKRKDDSYEIEWEEESEINYLVKDD